MFVFTTDVATIQAEAPSFTALGVLQPALASSSPRIARRNVDLRRQVECDSPSRMEKAGQAEIMSDETSLVAAAAAGDILAFRALYDLLLPKVLGQIRRLVGNGPHVEDLAQEVFVRVYRGLPTFEGRSNVRSWIFGITHHTTIDWLRRERRQPQQEELTDQFETADLRAALDARDHLRALEAGLSLLAPEAREAFVLHELEGKSLAEIAELTSTPLFTIATRVRRARERLANCFDAPTNLDGSKEAK